MVRDDILARYLAAILDGDRLASRSVIEEAMQTGMPAISVYSDIIWPIMEEVELLSRSGQISPVQEHMATRINRTIVDQLQNKLPRRPRKGTKIVVCCGPSELPELGAQITGDLFESDGWDIRFVGGGLTNDDILAFINQYAPDILLIYGSGPKQAPEIRRLIDTIRQVNAWPQMRIVLSGGVFNRAEGLAEHIGADLFAENAVQALAVASQPCRGDADPHQQATTRARRKRQKVVEVQQLVPIA